MRQRIIQNPASNESMLIKMQQCRAKRLNAAVQHQAMERISYEVGSDDAQEFLGEPQFCIEEGIDDIIAEELGDMLCS